MSKVNVIKKSFPDPENPGKDIEYERLAITGTLNGEPVSLEIKLSSAEIQLAKVLLAEPNEEPLF